MSIETSYYRVGKPAFNVFLTRALPFYSRFVLKYSNIKVREVTGRIPNKGGILIAPHHEEEADVFMIQSVIKRRLQWVAWIKFFGKNMLEYKLLKRISDLFGGIFIDPQNQERNKGLFEYITYLLKIEEAVVIFPEGSLRRQRNNKKLGKAKDGVIRIAQFAQKKLKRKIPIYPVGLEYKKKGSITEACMRIGTTFYVNNRENSKSAMLKLMKEIAILSNIKTTKKQ